MKTTNLNTTQAIVLEILETEPRARENDTFLIRRYVERVYKEVAGQSFTDAMICLEGIGFSFESVRRARQKIQAKRSDLVNPKVAELRHEKEEEYRDYARE